MAEVVISEFMDAAAVEGLAAAHAVIVDPDLHERKEALVEALEEGRIAGAALDVFAEKPPAAERRASFAGRANLLLTPQVAGLTEEANARVSALIADEVLKALGHGRRPDHERGRRDEAERVMTSP